MSEQHYTPLYFQEWNRIRNTVNAEQGWTLILRCLDYAQGNELPDEDDPVVCALFTVLSASIDRNLETVATKSAKARYSRYCLACKNSNTKALEYDRWSREIDGRRQSSTSASDRQRTSKTSTIQSNPIESNLNHNHNQNPLRVDDARSFDSHTESKTDGEYNPKLWECIIPKMFWGKFPDEADYYAYAEEHRDEILKMLDEMETQEGK